MQLEAITMYAALRAAQADGLEDAVEAEAEALFLTEDPLGDQVDIFNRNTKLGTCRPKLIFETLSRSPGETKTTCSKT